MNSVLIPSNQKGFTIVELMIATMVFSMILIIITAGVISFTNQYYKGVNSSTTQLTAQTAASAISEAIQFSSQDTVGTVNPDFFCAGTKLYVYTIGTRYSGTASASDRGLYEMDRAGASCSYRDPAGGKELLGEGMRLTYVNLVQVVGPAGSAPIWQLSLSVASGDDDLLCNRTLSSGTQGGCRKTDPPYVSPATVKGITTTDIGCKSQTGSQFCSTAIITTVAQQRILN